MLPDLVLKPQRNLTVTSMQSLAALGTIQFKYYISMFLAFFHPTHPPCNWT